LGDDPRRFSPLVCRWKVAFLSGYSSQLGLTRITPPLTGSAVAAPLMQIQTWLFVASPFQPPDITQCANLRRESAKWEVPRSSKILLPKFRIINLSCVPQRRCAARVHGCYEEL